MTRGRRRANATTKRDLDRGRRIELDGSGLTDCSTGIPFYDHMLDQLGRHGGFDLTVPPRVT